MRWGLYVPSRHSGGEWDFTFTVDVSVKVQVKINEINSGWIRHCCGSLGHLKRIDWLIILSVTPVLFLLCQIPYSMQMNSLVEGVVPLKTTNFVFWYFWYATPEIAFTSVVFGVVTETSSCPWDWCLKTCFIVMPLLWGKYAFNSNVNASWNH